MAWRAQAGEKLVSAFVRLQPWITGFGAPRVGHEEMEKAIILIGAYALASFIGALTGAMLWAEPFRMDDILGFMMMCPLFQFVSLITAFNTKNLILGILLLVVCGGTMTASVVWYYRSNRKWPVLTFAAPVFVASLQGAELLCEAIAA